MHFTENFLSILWLSGCFHFYMFFCPPSPSELAFQVFFFSPCSKNLPLAENLSLLQYTLLKDVSWSNKDCQVGGTLTSDMLSIVPGSCDRKTSQDVKRQKMTEIQEEIFHLANNVLLSASVVCRQRVPNVPGCCAVLHSYLFQRPLQAFKQV